MLYRAWCWIENCNCLVWTVFKHAYQYYESKPTVRLSEGFYCKFSPYLCGFSLIFPGLIFSYPTAHSTAFINDLFGCFLTSSTPSVPSSARPVGECGGPDGPGPAAEGWTWGVITGDLSGPGLDSSSAQISWGLKRANTLLNLTKVCVISILNLL